MEFRSLSEAIDFLERPTTQKEHAPAPKPAAPEPRTWDRALGGLISELEKPTRK